MKINWLEVASILLFKVFIKKPKYLGSFVLYSVSFCIIEGPETLQDFVQMQLQEIQHNIRSRRNKIFLLMEEVIYDLKASTIVGRWAVSSNSNICVYIIKVRRLRIQQRIKSAECSGDSCEDNEMPDIPSTIPFLPHMVWENNDSRSL